MKKITLLLLVLLCVQISFADVWNQKSKLPAIGRHRGTGIAIGDKGYIGLGHMNGTGLNIIYTDWWEYEPGTNSWTQKSDFPVGTYGATAFSIGFKGYVGGGTGLNSEFYEFNPVTNLWTQIANALYSTPSDETAFTINGRGYILDGSTLLEYKPSTDSWAQKAHCPITGWAITSFVIQNSAYLKIDHTLYEYKASIDQWIVRAPFPGISTNGAPSFSANSKGYIMTGYSTSLSSVFSEMWEYDPALNSWTQLEDFPGTSRRFAVAFAINNKGYLGTGTNGTNMNDFWEFNPALEGLGDLDNEIVTISIYPNPATEFITFNMSSLTDYSDLKLSIYNNSGQIITNSIVNSSNFILQRNNLANGVYTYTITNENKLITKGTFIFK
jgi:N-acetylneuraminic acid mutarotase